MQLISLPVSPFAARVRIALYAKGLDVEITPPPAGWPNNPRYRDVSPMGRVPALILDDGEAIWESAVILELLEELYPDARPLLPADVLGRAKARLLVRHVDLYLMPPMVALAAQPDPATTRKLMDQLTDGLGVLDGLIEGSRHAVGDALSFADCALAPALFAARVTGQRLNYDLTSACTAVRIYQDAVVEDEAVAQVLGEMEEGLRLLMRVG